MMDHLRYLMGGRRQGKSEAQRIARDAATAAGKRVLIVGRDGHTCLVLQRPK